VLFAHKGLSLACARFAWLRSLVRGRPRPLVKDGRLVPQALAAEGMSEEELRAGLRKLGHLSEREVKLAVLEETGHISAVPLDPN
jgi:uncharacterized membrane protein YcaP (DUF421 family)